MNTHFMQEVGTMENEPASTLTVSTSDNSVEEVRMSIESVLSNPKIRENAITYAQDIQKAVRDNWFTLDQVMKKTKMKGIQPTQDVLNLLCLFELAWRKEQDSLIKYKIVMNKEAKVHLLNGELSEAKAKVSYIEDEITKLNLS